MRPLRANFYIVLLCGSIVAAVLAVQPANLLFIQAWNALMPVQRALPDVSSWGLIGLTTDLVAGLAPWLLASVTFFRLGRATRYGFSPPGLSEGNAGQPQAAPAPSPRPGLRKQDPPRIGKVTCWPSTRRATTCG